MTQPDVTTAYNYTVFNRENVMPWLNFAGSPPLGQPAPDFPLWHVDGTEIRLTEIWAANRFTVVEFGSFT